ncbi:hypothetical protein HanPSC8_Chr11g0464001 [Helianthus annuus]|nr:hypothetical protein HanPSC8_Chr11g0464001 [Helianthus annuus]
MTTIKPLFQTLNSQFKLQIPLKLSPKPSKILSSQNPNHQPPPKSITILSILRSILDWADRVKERRMKQPWSLYKHSDCIRHRSSGYKHPSRFYNNHFISDKVLQQPLHLR